MGEICVGVSVYWASRWCEYVWGYVWDEYVWMGVCMGGLCMG